jgi:hypothetical protein
MAQGHGIITAEVVESERELIVTTFRQCLLSRWRFLWSASRRGPLLARGARAHEGVDQSGDSYPGDREDGEHRCEASHATKCTSADGPRVPAKLAQLAERRSGTHPVEVRVQEGG